MSEAATDTECECADGLLPGTWANVEADGVISVERCDQCSVFEGDLDAAWAIVQVAGGEVRFEQEGAEAERENDVRTFTGTYRDGDCIATGTDPWIVGADLTKLPGTAVERAGMELGR